MRPGARLLGAAAVLAAAFAVERGHVASYDRLEVSVDASERTRTQEALAEVLFVQPYVKEPAGPAAPAYNPARGRPRPRLHPCAARILTGENRGRVVAFVNRIVDRPFVDVHLVPGRRVRLWVTTREGRIAQAEVVPLPVRWRSLLWAAAVLCAVLIVVLGDLGARAMLLTIGCGAVLVFVAAPVMASGGPPLLVAGVSFLLVAALLLGLWGQEWRVALCAAAGALTGLAAAALVSLAASRLMGLTGGAWAIIRLLRGRPEFQALDFRQLLAAGMAIIAMGAALDIAVSVVSGLIAFQLQNPGASASQIRHVGLRLNRNVASTMVLTITTAWIALRLPVFLVMHSGADVFSRLWVKCYAAELTQVISAAIAVMLAGPATVLLFVHLLGRLSRAKVRARPFGPRRLAATHILLPAALISIALSSPLWFRQTQPPSDVPSVDVSAVRAETSTAALLDAAREWQLLGDWDSSMVVLWRARELAPDNPIVGRDLAYVYLSRGWAVPARDAIARALPALTDDARAQYIAGVIAFWEGDREDAKMRLERALRIDPALSAAADALAALGGQ